MGDTSVSPRSGKCGILRPSDPYLDENGRIGGMLNKCSFVKECPIHAPRVSALMSGITNMLHKCTDRRICEALTVERARTADRARDVRRARTDARFLLCDGGLLKGGRGRGHTASKGIEGFDPPYMSLIPTRSGRHGVVFFSGRDPYTYHAGSSTASPQGVTHAA